MDSSNKPSILVGVDIGGTLAKICIWCPHGVKVNLPAVENLRTPFKKGELIFVLRQTSESEGLFDVLKKLKSDFQFKSLYVTGGGAYKYIDQLNEIDPDFTKDAEIGALLTGFNFVMDSVDKFGFYYRYTTGPVYKPEYPFILVNIGSGVSVVKFTGKNTYTRVGGTTLGGGTFLGLSKLLVGTSDFDELLALAGKGQSDNLDLMIKDICHGQETPLSSLTSENIAVSLGKMTLEHIRDVKKFKKEDMIRSILFMVAFNVSQIAYYLAKNHKIKEIYFAGNFIRNHTDTMECISYALSSFSAHDGEKIDGIFIRHDGFLGSLGCVISSAEKQGFDITSET